MTTCGPSYTLTPAAGGRVRLTEIDDDDTGLYVCGVAVAVTSSVTSRVRVRVVLSPDERLDLAHHLAAPLAGTTTSQEEE